MRFNSIDERSLLKDLVEILTPFEEATDFTQKQNYVSVSFIISCIRGLRKAIEMINVMYNSEMLSTLKRTHLIVEWKFTNSVNITFMQQFWIQGLSLIGTLEVSY